MKRRITHISQFDPQSLADLVTFTEKSLMENLVFYAV